LPANLAHIADYENAALLILNVNSPDDLLMYLVENHKQELKSGRLILYNDPGDGPFRMAFHKNLAHRLAILEGADIIVTQDADNFMAVQSTGNSVTPNFAQYIAEQFAREPNGVFMASKMIRGVMARGIAGRLVVRSQDFIKAGGYDEKYTTWQGEDMDLNARLRRMGLAQRTINPCYLDAIRHGDGLRFKEYPHAKAFENDEEVKRIDAALHTVVNYGNIGCGTVYKNFDTEPTVLKPIPTRVFGIGMHKTATTSLNAAFKILGYDSFHWDRGDLAREIWDQMNAFGTSIRLERSYALSDLPIPLLYKQLDKAYPGSKFILTVRNELEWLMSVNRLWDARYNPNRWEWEVYPFTNRIHRALYGQTDFNPTVMLERYRKHNTEVLEYFKNRPDDLLIMDMDSQPRGHSGMAHHPSYCKCSELEWRGLCNFLGEPVPDVPYPRVWVTPKPPARSGDVPVAAVLEPTPEFDGFESLKEPDDKPATNCEYAVGEYAQIDCRAGELPGSWHYHHTEAEKVSCQNANIEQSRSIQPETVSLTLAPSDVGSQSADTSPAATDREAKEPAKDGYFGFNFYDLQKIGRESYEALWKSMHLRTAVKILAASVMLALILFGAAKHHFWMIAAGIILYVITQFLIHRKEDRHDSSE
jgi:hypothetical protein